MIRLESLYTLIESSFDFLLVADANEKTIYVSPLLKRTCSPSNSEASETHLVDILDLESLQSFRNAIEKVHEGARGVIALFATQVSKSTPIPMKVGYIESVHGGIYLFFGVQVDALRRISDWEKEERVKELSCLYTVAEWIEVSVSIKEFFTKLPEYLSRGMRSPDEAVVYSVFQGEDYGQKPSDDDYISVDLTYSGEKTGEIRVGYISGTHELLPEEQRMLTEIGRMLSVALERKELSERMLLKREEEDELNNRLKELEAQIGERERDLDEQKQKLSTADSYLDRVNRSWDETRQRLETMFKVIPGEVMLIDLNRNVVMSNQEEIEPGDKCYKTYFNRDTPCRDCRLGKIKREKTPITITIRDGDKFMEVHTLPVYNQEEQVDGILEFYRDVTLEKTYEQQIQQADKLASLGQLVSGIGHEINNPNQFIRGNIKIIRQAITDMLPIVDDYYEDHPDMKIARLKYDFFREHIMTLVDDMAHGSERIKGIVEGLRGFARKDEGLLVDTVDVNTLLEATTRLVKNEVHKHAEIVLELGNDLAKFTGNSQKIEQIFINLIVNAAQSIPDDKKGLITVRTHMDHTDNVLIEIEDNGKGMDEKTQRQIFDPFFTTKRAKGGTGLGLAIAFRIAEEHSGNITVSSRPGVGTKFTVRIPTGEDAAVEKVSN
ncbi:MAG: GHKL domain-containing protein [Candidatus Aegiribacteria sp.]|nr:GHKL domain-containing protein [Candidatus Aegiribacteria sp.]